MSDDWTDIDDRADEAHAWEVLREPVRRPGRGRRIVTLVGSAAVVALLALGAIGVWAQRQIDPSGPAGDELVLVVPEGSTTAAIGELLEAEGVIASSQVWSYWTRLRGVGPFQAGEYVFRLDSSFDEAADVLAAGPKPPDVDRVTIPEGLTVPEVLDRLADPERGIARWDRAVLQQVVDSGQLRSRFAPDGAVSLEGLLFPDTYEVDRDTDEAEFLNRLVVELDERLIALNVETRARAIGLDPYEVLVVASLIEEEARVPEERVKIARVIYNRLSQGIPLGIDATSRYEAELAGRDRDDIDFDSQSPYNTRRIAGLPPTPIAATGQASIEAALSPAEGPWIYYVLADAEGHHFFTDSAAEFQRAKQECIRLELGCG